MKKEKPKKPILLLLSSQNSNHILKFTASNGREIDSNFN